MVRPLLTVLTTCCVAIACPPAVPLSPCVDDADCPRFARCDRAHGYCAEPRPGDPICDRLQLQIDALADAEGEVVVAVVRDARDLAILARFDHGVRDGVLRVEQPFVVRQGGRYLVDAFLDVDDNLTCGAGDRLWRTALQIDRCPALALAGDPLGRPQDRCAPFGLTGDLDGSGCVDDADIDRLLADYGLSGALSTDLDRDGEVGLSDLTLLLANYCAGEPVCCTPPDGGVQVEPPAGLRGDADCNRRLTAADVTAFAQCQDDPAGFAQAHPGCSRANCDVNCDGTVDAADLPILEYCAITLQVCRCD